MKIYMNIEIRGETYEQRELIKKAKLTWNGKTWDGDFNFECEAMPTKEEIQGRVRKILGIEAALRACQIIIRSSASAESNLVATITSKSYTGPKEVMTATGTQSDGGTEASFWS